MFISYDTDPDGPKFGFPRVIVELSPGRWCWWSWEIRYIYQDDIVWTHFHKHDGYAWGFKNTLVQSKEAADNAWFELAEYTVS